MFLCVMGGEEDSTEVGVGGNIRTFIWGHEFEVGDVWIGAEYSEMKIRSGESIP